MLYRFDGVSPRKNPQLALSADSARLAFYAGDVARVFEVASGQEIAAFALPQNPGILAFDPRGSLLAVTDVGSRNTPATWQTRIFLVERQALVTRLPKVRVKAWSQNGEWLLTQGNPGAGEGPALLETDTYRVVGTFTVGENVSIELSATPTFVGDVNIWLKAHYSSDASERFTGKVYGNGAQRYENRQFGGARATSGLEVASGWEAGGSQVENDRRSRKVDGFVKLGSRAWGRLELKHE